MLKKRLLIVTLLVALGIVLLVAPLVTLFVVLPAVQQAREEARREATTQNLKELGVSLHNDHAGSDSSATPTAGSSSSSE